MDVFGQQNLKIFGNLRPVLVDTYVPTKIILKLKGWICTICRKFQDGRVNSESRVENSILQF